MMRIEKELSANDLGETGGHQAGIHVPKSGTVLSFFPVLDDKVKNPRKVIVVTDGLNHKWAFTFIYYNNRYFGGTRNEYRLTGMTKYFHENKLKVGDVIILSRESWEDVSITYCRSQRKGAVLKLGTAWRIIEGEF